MQKRTWIRSGVAVVAFSALVAVAGLAAPSLLNIDQYKPAMIAAVKEATGRELVIEGPLKLTVFPTLRISARQVHFANAVGAKGAQMVDVRWVGVRPSFWALLQGRIEIERLTLFRPTLVLESDAEGRPNWEFHPGAGAAQPAGAPSSGLHLAIGTVKIREGTLSYTNPKTGQTLRAENLEALASVGSLQGPFDFDATATVNGVPLSLMAKVGAPMEKGSDMSFKLKVQSGTLNFDGHVSRIAPDADIKGKVSLATGGLTDFIASLVRAGGQEAPAFDTAAIGPFAFDGDIDLSAEKLALTDFRMSIGSESVSGSVTLVPGANPSLESHLSLPRVDAEKWLALLSNPGAFRPKPVAAPSTPPPVAPAAAPAAPAAAPAAPAKASAAPSSDSLSPFPPGFTVLLSVDAKEVAYRKGLARDVGLAVEIRNGIIAVPRLSATLPGDMVLKANAAAVAPAAPAPKQAAAPPIQSAGQFSLAGPRLRETLAWLEIDTSGVPAGKLQTLAIEGKVASTPNSLQISDLAMDLDGQRATGSGSITFGRPLTLATSVQLDSFDLDAYLPQPREPSVVAEPATSVAPAPAPTAAPATPDKTLPILGLKAKVAKLVFRGGTLNGVDADLSVQGNLLKVNALKVAELLGAKFDLKGQVADFGTAPRFDFTFNATMPDTDKLLVYAGMPKFLNGKLGASTAGGSVAGTTEALTLRNASVTAAGATARATGSLVLGDKFAFDLSNFSVQAQDASGLVSVATGKPQTGLGGLAAEGAFKGNDQRASFEGNLTAIGTQMSGRIDATLGARPSFAANLRIPGTLDLDDWLGVTDGPPAAVPTPALPAAPAGANAEAVPLPSKGQRAATDKQIDLSGLRAFDATLNLETSAIEVGALKVTYADMNATLRNGIFKVSKLTGQFYSGAVDFAGTVDASKDTMTVDVAGTLQGIYVGEMLRGAAGQNVFGNEHLKVAVDGKINVMRIALQGHGNSPGQIRDSLTGQGHLSGVVYPSVAGGSLGFASFATGIGSLFSTEMGFNSAVISGFINAQSTIEGDITLSNGEINLQNHALKGPNATARINSRTSLTAATTETTIALDAGSNGATDYVMTVSGPVSAPTMSIRGK
ncbi:AsmA family protein [Reyranella sp.]|uniref:AsmA family protein n=1 Tax=Reyranella sp. TaxID=1929291 RepID=UPI0025F0479C|nr:AsmA family protein [Reyranella sp.]